MAAEDDRELYDCIIVGAGPGGLQAGIHLGRYNFKVLLFHTPGGRTHHARHIENYLGIDRISGGQLIETGLEQVKRFGVRVEKAKVERVAGEEGAFEVTAGGKTYRSRYVIAASGAKETIAPYKNIARFFGTSYFTCLICDGYRTTGKKTVVIDRSVNGVRTSMGVKQLFTDDVTFIAQGIKLNPHYASLLADEGVPLVEGKPEELVGEKALEGVKLSDGRVIPCEAILGWGGISMNDDYLESLDPERDADGFKIVTNGVGESSVPGLFVLGALRQGHSQAIISAGQGADAAIEISTRVVEI